MTDLTFLERENDPKILRELIKLVVKHSDRLEGQLKAALIEQEKNKQTELNLGLSYSILRNEYFGRGREKLHGSVVRPRENRQEVLIHAQTLVPRPKEDDLARLNRVQQRHTASTEWLDSQLRQKELALSPDQKPEWKELAGFSENSSEITVVERTYKIIEHQRQKYKTTIVLSSGQEKDVIIAAPGPEKLLPGCSYSIDFAVSVVIDKYLMHLPLERQRRAMQSAGLKGTEVKTMWNLVWAVGEHLKPVAQSIRGQILNPEFCVCADETPWPIHNKKDDDGYLWSISNMAGSYYTFEPTRSGKVIEEMLKGFGGVVMSDGYSGYNRLKNSGYVKVSNCWAHVRRKFYQIEKANPGSVASQMVDMLNELFSFEREAKTFEDLKIIREQKSKFQIEKVKKWLDDQLANYFRESPMKSAILYTIKLWPGLTEFLTDVRIPLSNNDAERVLRHAVVGRKNYYGSKSIDGADTAATLFSVIESCKRVEIDPSEYINMAVRMSVRGQNAPTPLDYARSLCGLEKSTSKTIN